MLYLGMVCSVSGQILWSDEFKFEICQNVQRRSRERYNSMSLKPTLKRGRGFLMLWGYISASDVVDYLYNYKQRKVVSHFHLQCNTI